MQDEAQRRPGSARMIIMLSLVGLFIGAPAGWMTGKLMKAAKLQALPWSDEAALTLAMVFLGGGLLIAILSLDRKGQAILASPRAPEFQRIVSPSQTLLVRLQSGVLILAGLLLATPVAIEVMTKGGTSVSGPPIMAMVAASLVLQTGLNIAIWRRSDEVYRRVIAESGAACFWVLQGLFFLWACGEKLKVLPAISSWDAVTVMMGVYLLTSSILAYRNGIE